VGADRAALPPPISDGVCLRIRLFQRYPWVWEPGTTGSPRRLQPLSSLRDPAQLRPVSTTHAGLLEDDVGPGGL
jgi:hypothetical protein